MLDGERKEREKMREKIHADDARRLVRDHQQGSAEPACKLTLFRARFVHL